MINFGEKSLFLVIVNVVVDDIGTICCHSERSEESWKTYLKI